MSDRLVPSAAPIFGWFIPRVIPYGGAPESIKQQWLDVPLPFRYQLLEAPELHIGSSVTDPTYLTVYEDGITIAGLDAVKALRIFDRDNAAEWWEANYVTPNLERLGVCDLLFNKKEGEILPDRLARMLMPGIETFDQLEI